MGGQADRLRYFFSASAMEQRQIGSGDREISSFPVPGTGGDPGQFRAHRWDDSFFSDPDSGETFDATLRQAVPGAPTWDPDDPFGPDSDFKAYGPTDAYNFSPNNLFADATGAVQLLHQFRLRVDRSDPGLGTGALQRA